MNATINYGQAGHHNPNRPEKPSTPGHSDPQKSVAAGQGKEQEGGQQGQQGGEGRSKERPSQGGGQSDQRQKGRTGNRE